MRSKSYVFHNSKLIASSNIYDSIGSFLYNFNSPYVYGPYADLGYAIVNIKNKFGVVNSNGEMCIPAIYDKIIGICKKIIKKNRSQWNDYDVVTGYTPSLLLATYKNKYNFFTADINLKKLNIKYICQESINNFFIYSNNNIPLEYKRVYELEQFVQQSEASKEQYKFGIIDSKGNIILNPSKSLNEIRDIAINGNEPYETWSSNCSECVILKKRKTNKFALFNNNTQLSEFEFDSISEFNEDGMALTSVSNQGVGIINKDGKIILPCKYEIHNGYNINIDNVHNYRSGFRLYDGFLAFSINGKYGLLDKMGNIVVPCKYPPFYFSYNEQSLLISKGYIAVRYNCKLGLIKISNSTDYLLKPKYDQIKVFFDTNYLSENGVSSKYHNYIIAEGDDESLIIEIESGNIIFSVKDYIIKRFYLITKSYIAIHIEKQGQQIMRLFSIDNTNIYKDFSDLGYWNEDFAQICCEEKWGVFDFHSGKEIIPCIYEEKVSINETSNLFKVKLNGKYGFINLNNDVIIPCSYDQVHNFKDGIAAICSNSKWSFVNEKGLFIACDFDDILDFNNNFAAVKKGVKWGYINTKGEIIIPIKFDKAESFSDGLAAVAFGDRYGYIDKYNNTIIPFEYSKANKFGEGVARVYKGSSSYGTITKDGDIIDWHSPEDDYDNSYEEPDYARDTWDALTDGQYGEYPGSGVDYDILGF